MSNKFHSSFDDNSGKESAICASCGSALVTIEINLNLENNGVRNFYEAITTYTCTNCSETDSVAP